MSKEEIEEKIDYLFSKINWVHSPLDAKAIEIMNNLKSDIKKCSDIVMPSNQEIFKMFEPLDNDHNRYFFVMMIGLIKDLKLQ